MVNNNNISFTNDLGRSLAKKSKWQRSKVPHYVRSINLKESYLAGAIAGRGGMLIYIYLKWKEAMNGRQFESLPNAYFLLECKLPRQRKSEAILKLEKEKFIICHRSKGHSTKVKLNTPQKDSNGKSKTT